MERIPVVIMDDEKPACERLTKILSGFPQIEIKGVFTRTEEGITFILQKKPRVVFLDIEMENNISAFDVINTLNKHGSRPIFILVTGYEQYVLKALKYEVFDYIMKPVDVDELKETLDILISDGAGTRDYEMFSGGEAFRVNFAIRLALSRVLAHRAGARHCCAPWRGAPRDPATGAGNQHRRDVRYAPAGAFAGYQSVF